MTQVVHENIVRYFHSYTSEESAKGSLAQTTLHIYMEYCDGGSVREAVSNYGNSFQSGRGDDASFDDRRDTFSLRFPIAPP